MVEYALNFAIDRMRVGLILFRYLFKEQIPGRIWKKAGR